MGIKQLKPVSNEQEAERQIKKSMEKNQKKFLIKAAVQAIIIPIIIIIVKILAITLIVIAIIGVIVDWIDGDDIESEEEYIVIADPYVLNKGVSPFGCIYTKPEFIELAKQYDKPEDTEAYQENMVKYADILYDVCVTKGVNPCFAWAHACIETGYGTSHDCIDLHNWFGFKHGNNDKEGKDYSEGTTIEKAIENSVADYCDWIVDSATEGTDRYAHSLSEARKI